MQQTVRGRLLVAVGQLHQAGAGGTTREVVSDAYQAIDNALTAYQLLKGGKVIRNHKANLERFLGAISWGTGKGDTKREALLALYEKWLKVRYGTAQSSWGEPGYSGLRVLPFSRSWWQPSLSGCT